MAAQLGVRPILHSVRACSAFRLPMQNCHHSVQRDTAHFVTTVALAGRSATFWMTAMKKPPVSMWCGSTRMQRSRWRSPGFSGNIDLHRRPCVSLCTKQHVASILRLMHVYDAQSLIPSNLDAGPQQE